MNNLFSLPLPSPLQNSSDSDIAQIEVRRVQFDPLLTIINNNSATKDFSYYRHYCEKDFEEESLFISLLQFLLRIREDSPELLVIVGGDWTCAQLELVVELFPSIKTIDCWQCSLDKTSPIISKKRGFPSFTSYTGVFYMFLEFKTMRANQILQDMTIQRNIVENTKPTAFSVRFRPPFRQNVPFETIEYFDGIMETICHGMPSSTATRIFSRRERDTYYCKDYNLYLYECCMNHYNTELRSFWTWEYNGVPGTFDTCYSHYILGKVLGDNCTQEDIANLQERIHLTTI